MSLFYKVADVQTEDMLKLPVPEIMGGKPTTIAVDPSPELKEYTEKLAERAELVHRRAVPPEQDNMLCITNDGRNAALDMRCIDPAMPDYPDSKVNVCIQKVFDIYKATADDKLTQMIFSDLSTPKNGKAFSVYDDIKAKLINMGVSAGEIAFIHDCETDEQKEKLFSSVRRGEVRIILGSTQMMGAGTNAQTKLIALHHIDCPYRPADLEQRNGRIIRQGNNNPEVQIYQYITRQSFDAYLWQIVETKQKFISQVMSGKTPTREMQDVDATVLNYAEVKAIATGNPYIKRKMELDFEVQRLSVLESQYRENRYKLEDNILKHLPAEIAGISERIKNTEADIERRDKNSGDDFQMKIGKHSFSERKEAGELLLKAVQSGQYADKVIGQFRGFDIVPRSHMSLLEAPAVTLVGAASHTVELSDSGLGSVMRIENSINGLEKVLENHKKKLFDTQNRLEASKTQLSRPFDQEQEFRDVLAELATVNSMLNIDKTEDADALLPDADEKKDVLEMDEEEDEQEY